MASKGSKVSVDILKQNKSHAKHRLVKDFDVLVEVVEVLKKHGLKIVLTQGVYDLIHEGHAKYLEMAKSYGDVLIVGLDSDALTKHRKGPTRPIVPETERVEMLVHLRHVDLVFMKELKHDIGDLIRHVKPDVLITSESTSDFGKELAKTYKEYCGRIVTLPAQSTTSTSARIRQLTIDGAEQLAQEITRLTQEYIQKIRQQS